MIYEEAGGEGMDFYGEARVVAEGGTVTSTEAGLQVRDADGVTLYFAAGTSFNGFDRSPGKDGVNPAEVPLQRLDASAGVPGDALWAAHVADYQGALSAHHARFWWCARIRCPRMRRSPRFARTAIPIWWNCSSSLGVT